MSCRFVSEIVSFGIPTENLENIMKICEEGGGLPLTLLYLQIVTIMYEIVNMAIPIENLENVMQVCEEGEIMTLNV